MEMDRIAKVDQLLKEITKLLPCIYDSGVTDEYKGEHFLTNPDGTEILSTYRDEVEILANLFDQLTVRERSTPVTTTRKKTSGTESSTLIPVCIM